MSILFSIITVTRNAALQLSQTMQSVSQQSCSVYEHIIMDGQSTDLTVEMARSMATDKTLIISQPDSGIYDAMNSAMALARGDYLIFLNAGDTFHCKDTLQHLANAIMDNDYPGIVYGQTNIVDKEGKYLGPRHLIAPEKLSLESFKEGMVVCHQAMTVLTKIAPYYNLKYRYSSDYEWAIECLMHSRHNVYLPEVTIDYLSEGATTSHHRESLKERYKIMCTYFGTIPTLFQHIKFAFRYLLRRNKASNIQ